MQGHDGESLALMLKTSEMKVSTFAQRMGVSRITPSRWSHMAKLSDTTLNDAAKVLHLELADFFPRFARKAAQNQHKPSEAPEPLAVAESTATAYAKNATPPVTNLDDCRAQVLHWQGKAYDNLEQYTRLLTLYLEVVKKLPDSVQQDLAQQHQHLSVLSPSR